MSVNSKDIAARLGPLPKSDDNARLQRESVKALHKLLAGQDDLLLREETKEDFGVDCSFELSLGGQMTNFRAQIQMKSSAHLAVTAKGYIPLHPPAWKSSNRTCVPFDRYQGNALTGAGTCRFWKIWWPRAIPRRHTASLYPANAVAASSVTRRRRHPRMLSQSLANSNRPSARPAPLVIPKKSDTVRLCRHASASGAFSALPIPCVQFFEAD